LRELAGRLAANHQRADDLLGAQQRHHEQGPIAGVHDDVDGRGGAGAQVRQLHRRTLLRGVADRRIAYEDMPVPDRRDQGLVHAIGRAQLEFPARFVERVDRSRLGGGQLHGLGDDGVQYGGEIQRRIDGVADLAESAQFLDRPGQFGGARPQFVEQPHVLDRDHRLIGKIRDQLNLLAAERSDFLAVDADRADQFALLQHRHVEKASHTAKLDGGDAPRLAVDV
jgi:hypothetical protein